MTTPAVNRNITKKRNVTQTTRTTAANGTFTETSHLYDQPRYYFDREARPASGSTPIGPSGFRPCRAWSHSGHRYVLNSCSGFYDSKVGASQVRYTFDNNGLWGEILPPTVPSISVGQINRTEVQALNKLKDQDIHLGNFIAEFNRTEAMVAHRVSSIAGGVRRWRSNNSKKSWNNVKKYMRSGCGRKFRRLIPASWLELVYGWSPLLQDIFGAVNHLSKMPKDPLISVKGYTRVNDSVVVHESGYYGANCDMEYPVSQEVWVRLYYRINTPGLAEVSSLGLLNPAEIAWELTPYSFVLDWVLPIGPWLSALTADAGYSFVGGSRSQMTKAGSGRTKRYVFPRTASTFTGGSLPVLEGESYAFQRVCYTSSPVPGVYVKNPLSAMHVANAIALLVQAFRD